MAVPRRRWRAVLRLRAVVAVAGLAVVRVPVTLLAPALPLGGVGGADVHLDDSLHRRDDAPGAAAFLVQPGVGPARRLPRLAEHHRGPLRVPVHSFLVPAPELQAVVRDAAVERVHVPGVFLLVALRVTVRLAQRRALRAFQRGVLVRLLQVLVAVRVLHLVHGEVRGDPGGHAQRQQKAVRRRQALDQEQRHRPRVFREPPQDPRTGKRSEVRVAAPQKNALP